MRATYYRHSCMLDNIRSDDEREDYVDFQVVDAEDDEDEVNHRAMSIFDLNEDESDEEQSSEMMAILTLKVDTMTTLAPPPLMHRLNRLEISIIYQILTFDRVS